MGVPYRPQMPQQQTLQGKPAVPGKAPSIALSASHRPNIQRKVFIDNDEIGNLDEWIKQQLQKADENQKKVMTAWHNSALRHDFDQASDFLGAVNDNVKILKSWAQAKELFKAKNFLFSTKGDSRAETLYFRDADTGMSGRLRQQHSSGPAAKIDRDPKQHLFVETQSAKEDLKSKYKKGKEASGLENYAKDAKDNWYHIEYAVDENNKLTNWHPSNGIVNTSTDNIATRISTALKEILGI